MPYGGTTSCPKHGLELKSPAHYEFPKESVEAIKRGFLIASRRSRGGVCGMSPISLKIGRGARGNLKSCQEPIFLRLVARWVM